ncbi:hypothetical protein F5X71_29680 [Nocardia brasiliensis]|uniref:SGNH hydrolase-type esterase domain-containing protein n=1 Tax=Nocardia brasiliensis TaxID=37326 RepID=A0A6G9XYA7_NOCBR|nr:SGNH/GDSL hydrolase family protein [Nocardia brasiliensis]QIS05922.1 hypothetical protein F5X71_29680 [Nocardia brasiliensis]
MNYIEDGIAGAYASEKTRIISYCNGGMDQTVAPNITVSTQAGFRTSIKLPVSTRRWRVKLRNFGMTGASKTALTGKGVRFGEAARVTTGNGTTSRTGGFVANSATTIVSGDFPIPGDGSWYYTPWVTTPLEAGREYLLAIGYTVSSSTSVQTTIGECFYWTSAASALDPTVTSGSSIPAGIPIDFVVEFECVSARSAWLFIGDSIAEGVMGSPGTSASSIVPQPIWRSYPQLWATRNDALVLNMSMAGIMTPQFNSYPEFFSRLDLAGAQLDGAVIATGSNDFNQGRTLAQFQGDVSALMAKVRTTIGDKPIYLCTTIPRSSTGYAERSAANRWMATLPYGAAGVVDMDGTLRTWNGSSYVLEDDYTCDTIHPSFLGSERMAAALASVVAPIRDR